MKTRETSTREQALAWWNSLSDISIQMPSKSHLCKQYHGDMRIHKSLTGREIEQIYDKEVLEPKRQEEWQESQVNRRYSKPNQKQYSQEEVDRLLDQQAARTTAQMVKNNQKQFKQFDESLFRAYIEKFSEEDKLKAINCLGGFTVDQTVRAYSCGYGDRDANLPQFHGEKPVDYLNKLKH